MYYMMIDNSLSSFLTYEISEEGDVPAGLVWGWPVFEVVHHPE